MVANNPLALVLLFRLWVERRTWGCSSIPDTVVLMVVEFNTMLMWNGGSSALALALSLLMDAGTSLPGNGQWTAPTLPSCIPEEHGGARGLVLLLHSGASGCPPPCHAWAGSIPGSILTPAPTASQAVQPQKCLPSSLLSMSVPLRTSRVVTLCECHED